MEWTERRLLAFDKTPLFYRLLSAQGPSKGIVLIVHGMGEHGGRYRHLAEFLSISGFDTVVPDLRGFGQSGGVRAFAPSFDALHRDIDAYHALIEHNYPQKPVFFLGHSFGGLVTSSFLALHPRKKVSGLVLSSPIFGIARPVPAWRHVLGMAASYVLPKYSEPTHVDPKLLSHDPEMLKIYLADVAIHHRITARLYRELTRMIGRRDEIAARLTAPLLVLQAGEDHIVSKKSALRFYDRAASSDKELEVYPDFYHEILNETDRQAVFTRIANWLLKRVN